MLRIANSKGCVWLKKYYSALSHRITITRWLIGFSSPTPLFYTWRNRISRNSSLAPFAQLLRGRGGMRTQFLVQFFFFVLSLLPCILSCTSYEYQGKPKWEFFFKRLSNEELCISSFAHQFGKHSLGTFYARNYPPRQWGMNKWKWWGPLPPFPWQVTVCTHTCAHACVCVCVCVWRSTT